LESKALADSVFLESKALADSVFLESKALALGTNSTVLKLKLWTPIFDSGAESSDEIFK